MQNCNKCLIIVLLVFTSFRLYSQKMTVLGYIIEDTDTIQGQVVDNKSNKNQSICLFMDQNGFAKKYKPDEIKAWGTFEGKHFRSVTVNENNISVQQFAQVLVKGFADLLVYHDKDGNERFFIRSNDNTYSEVTDPDSPKDSNKTKGRLIYLFKKSPELRVEISKSNFNRDNIIAFTSEYHLLNCPNEKCEIFIEKKRTPTMNFGIHAGVSFSSLRFATSEYQNLDNTYKTSFSPTAGLSGELSVPSLDERFGLRLELVFQTNSYVGDEVTFKMSTLRIPLYAVYHLGNMKNTLELYVGVYGGLNFNMSQTGVYIENPLHGLRITKEKLVEFPNKTLGFGISGGIGYLVPISKKQELILSMCYSKNWSNMLFRYYAEPIDHGSYGTWTETAINYDNSFLDFKVGLRF